MSAIPTTAGLLGSAAGAPLSQTTASTSGTAQKESAAVERRAAADEKAEQAGGIGQTEEDEQTDERDADGRRLWERSQHPASESDALRAERPVKDPSGNAGNVLDLVG
jgi:hypothetical protein